MKITKRQLRRIIREIKNRQLTEFGNIQEALKTDVSGRKYVVGVPQYPTGGTNFSKLTQQQKAAYNFGREEALAGERYGYGEPGHGDDRYFDQGYLDGLAELKG